MKERWKRFRRLSLVISFCMLALGIVMVIWPEISAVAVCCVLGIICLSTGIYEMVRYFNLGFAGLFFRFDLTLGICSILAGILLLLHPAGAAALLPFAAGLYIITGSVFDIQSSVEMRRLGIGNWWLSMVMGVVSTIFAFFLLLNPFQGVAALMVFIGISLIVGSIQNLYTVHCISSAVKASRKDGVIDVSWRSID